MNRDLVAEGREGHGVARHCPRIAGAARGPGLGARGRSQVWSPRRPPPTPDRNPRECVSSNQFQAYR